MLWAGFYLHPSFVTTWTHAEEFGLNYIKQTEILRAAHILQYSVARSFAPIWRRSVIHKRAPLFHSAAFVTYYIYVLIRAFLLRQHTHGEVTLHVAVAMVELLGKPKVKTQSVRLKASQAVNSLKQKRKRIKKRDTFNVSINSRSDDNKA